MNDGVYPRTLPPLGFDLMARQVKRGDRSRRDDDRYLYLEALLSAQEQLYISYIGRSIQDNSLRYPSVLVSELMEYIGQSYCLEQDRQLSADDSEIRVRDHLAQWHSRTPFDAGNFDGDKEARSYAAEWLPAAGGQGTAISDFNQPLSELPLTEISLDSLLRFYRHPIKAFFQMRLNVSFTLEETELSDEEPFIVDNLNRYQLNTQLLNTLIEQQDPAVLFNHVKASGGLPYGAFGEIFWSKQCEEMSELADQVREARGEAGSMELALEVGDVQLTGWMHQVQADGLLRWRPAALLARDGLLLWIEHVVYCASGGSGESRMFGRSGTAFRFANLPPDVAMRYLGELIIGYRQGLSSPLMLLSKSGWAWLDSCYDRQSGMLSSDAELLAKGQNKLIQIWQGDGRVPGEGEDPYVQRVMRQLDQVNIAAITAESVRFLLPVIQHNLA